MSTCLDSILAEIDAGAAAARDRLINWLRIPSISAQPAHAADCLRAADWAREHLAAIGFRAEIRPTAGHPCVVAHHPGTGGKAPHLLFYGHYDVQPADPLSLWRSPPFEPAIMEGPHGPRVVARGAVDDKGQVAMWLEALRAWHVVAGGPPCPVTVLLEGEEEVGSPSLDAFLAANRAELKADVAVISDTGMWDIATPAITTRLRGMVYAQIDLFAASRDLHSGLYGGAALNPINALTRILGELQDADGRIQIPGFYEGIQPVSNVQAAEWAALGFDEAAFLGEIGLKTPAGERGRGALERLWARPTADLNGIWGGYTGEGGKTVIAAEAHAKLSCRLVPGQDPQKVAAGIRQFVMDRLPPDARAEVSILNTTPGIEVPADSPWVQAARGALAAEYGRPAVLVGSGGSIPVVESLKRLLGLDSLLVGFGLNDDQVHSPNEKFELTCLHKGARSHARMLAAFAGR
ncbi:dipeptidase [Siccirubricoccus sp. KC 17139]|uniref:Dipeptidase n=1 Tax=Siccirubricoccus soli TaxID=2899147 RepID=A0ABT1D185_9PROT|nr:dipeptidase [Siccirubricoccus soli]MCO6415639.1 dipeptidase [Siccirubricoccus soli]MCP2681771.1 dipeptidase [Siccirubricoccus soli]